MQGRGWKGKEFGKIGKGEHINAFQREYADRYGVKYGIAVNSGTSAMHTCVAAMNPDPGDEIIYQGDI